SAWWFSGSARPSSSAALCSDAASDANRLGPEFSLKNSRLVRRSTLILGSGTVILLAGAVITLGPWLEAYRWQASPMAVQAERNAAVPQLVPVHSTPTRMRSEEHTSELQSR